MKLLEQALDNAEGNREIHVRTLLLLAYAWLNTGDFGAALQNADRAAVHAENVGSLDLTSQALYLSGGRRVYLRTRYRSGEPAPRVGVGECE